MYLVEKNHRWIDLQYKIIITKYLNIAIAFHQTRALSPELHPLLVYFYCFILKDIQK
jgi:hypothetical protein